MGKVSKGIIIGVIAFACLLLFLGVIMVGGVLFLFTQDFGGSEEKADFDLNVQARVDTNQLDVIVLKGSVSWSEYCIVANGVHLTTFNPSTSVGERAYFYGLQISPGDSIEVQVQKIPSNKVVWERTIIAL